MGGAAITPFTPPLGKNTLSAGEHATISHQPKKRFSEDVCAHQIRVAVLEVAERAIGHFCQKQVIHPMGPTQVANGRVPARFHDLDGSGSILHPPKPRLPFEK